jgi:XFP N-terminal domain
MDAYWRAANYLSIDQIYLYDNPLLKQSPTQDHIKPRLLGHWGTTPMTHSNDRGLLFDAIIAPAVAGATRTVPGRCPVRQGCPLATGERSMRQPSRRVTTRDQSDARPS